MNARLKHRLEKIERTLPKPVREPVFDSRAWTASLTAKYGIVPVGNESWAEAIAKAMGLTPQQLRAEFQRRAQGLDSYR
jgi:hypothetical protein